MTTSKKNIIKLSMVLIGFILASVLSIGAVVINTSKAKYIEQHQMVYDNTLADFNVNFTLSYGSEPDIHSYSAEDLVQSNGLLRMSINDYSTMKLTINHNGQGWSYLRFKVVESWQHTDSNGKDIITPKELSTYTLDETMYDNRDIDGYIYCKSILKDEQSIQAITKCVSGNDAVDLLSSADASQFVDVSVEIEAVQWNQAQEVWGLTSLPWE